MNIKSRKSGLEILAERLAEKCFTKSKEECKKIIMDSIDDIAEDYIYEYGYPEREPIIDDEMYER